MERAGAAGTGNPNGRGRLLDRPRPDVDERQLKVLPVPRKDLAGSPGLDDKVMRLTVSLALLDGRDPVADVDVHRSAQRHPRDDPAAADRIEHRIFLGDTNRR